MRKSERSHTIDVVFVLAVACAFAASILMVLMLGVSIYGNIQQSSDEGFHERVCLSYITAKVHSNDRADGVRAGDFEGVSALFLEEDFYGDTFNTIIYAHDGWLRELFIEKDLDLPLESGTPILEVDAVSFEAVLPNLLSVEFTDSDGNSGKAFVSLRSKGGDSI